MTLFVFWDVYEKLSLKCCISWCFKMDFLIGLDWFATVKSYRVWTSLRGFYSFTFNMFKDECKRKEVCLMSNNGWNIVSTWNSIVVVCLLISWGYAGPLFLFVACQYCFGKVFPVWNFPAFYFMHANCPNGDGNQWSFGRFRYYYVNYRTFARR